LGESLNATRSKTKGTIVNVTDADSFSSKIPYLLFGAVASFSGIAIYYILPYAVL